MKIRITIFDQFSDEIQFPDNDMNFEIQDAIPDNLLQQVSSGKLVIVNSNGMLVGLNTLLNNGDVFRIVSSEIVSYMESNDKTYTNMFGETYSNIEYKKLQPVFNDENYSFWTMKKADVEKIHKKLLKYEETEKKYRTESSMLSSLDKVNYEGVLTYTSPTWPYISKALNGNTQETLGNVFLHVLESELSLHGGLKEYTHFINRDITWKERIEHFKQGNYQASADLFERSEIRISDNVDIIPRLTFDKVAMIFSEDCKYADSIQNVDYFQGLNVGGLRIYCSAGTAEEDLFSTKLNKASIFSSTNSIERTITEFMIPSPFETDKDNSKKWSVYVTDVLTFLGVFYRMQNKVHFWESIALNTTNLIEPIPEYEDLFFVKTMHQGYELKFKIRFLSIKKGGNSILAGFPFLKHDLKWKKFLEKIQIHKDIDKSISKLQNLPIFQNNIFGIKLA